MSRKVINSKQLDEILEKMIQTVHNSKSEIFDIGESSRKEFESLAQELKLIQFEVGELIHQQDNLERQVRAARNRLSEVSKQFNKYSEQQIREAYDQAHTLQLNLQAASQKEMQLRSRRDDIERRLVSLQETIEKAERLVGQISVVLNYMTNDLQKVGEAIADAADRREFGFKIMEAQEEERRKLSREIHDGPAQMLANVMMRSDLIERTYRERGKDEALKEIKSLKVMVRNALYEVRRIIYDLRPMALDDLGLVPTLKKYISTIEEYHKGKPAISFTEVGTSNRLSNDLEVALFRLVQESVQNAIKHAKAKLIQVKLEVTSKKVSIIIKDNGIGFDQTVKKTNSFGLIGMKERVDLIGGEIDIQSHPGKGTIVFIQIPIT